MVDVFISYPRKDPWIMRTLRAEIEKAGFSVWADEKLEPGHETWTQVISSQIETASCFVVVVTPNTKDSRWIEKEVTYAETHGKVIIPVFATTQARDVPFHLSGSQGVELYQDYELGIHQLLKYIRISVHPDTVQRVDRVGSLYWLGADLGQLCYEISNGNARTVRKFFRQICHHARRLDLPASPQERMNFLRDSTVRLTDEDWTPDKRREAFTEIDRLLGDAGTQIVALDPDWEPYDKQNIHEGLV